MWVNLKLLENKGKSIFPEYFIPFSNQKLQPEWLAKFDVSPMEKYQIYKNKKHRRLEEIILNLVTR